MKPSASHLLAGASLAGLLSSGCAGETAPDDDGQAAAGVANQTTSNWSDWKNTINFQPGGQVLIPADKRILFDESDAALQIGKLIVEGTFECATGPRTLNVEGVLVRGTSALFKCGTPLAPRTDKLTIQLGGHSSFTMADAMVGDCMPHENNLGEQSFVVVCGGRLELFGATPATVWTRLSANALAGATTLTLPSGAATGWNVGDEIAVATTSFVAGDTELKTLAAGTGATTLKLGTALAKPHWGTAETHTRAAVGAIPAKTWTLREQAEVANLTRSITIRGTADDNKGAHMMFTADPGIIKVSGVELHTMGRMGEMGRYPIHWHMVGDAPGHFLEKSVIRGSFNRCATVHGTNDVLLSGNVCYDHYGHGFFLENGTEENNTFANNVVFRSKKVPQGKETLYSDVTSDSPARYAAPAAFWVSNPNNTFTGNAAAGGDGTGFWIALKDGLHALTSPSPRRLGLLKFESNVAHSVRQGFSIDGGPNGACADDPTTPAVDDNPRNPGCNATGGVKGDVQTKGTNYDPPSAAANVLRKITAYKCREYGVWNRSLRGSIQNSVFADNLIHAGLVFSTELSDSVVIAASDNWDGDLAGTQYRADNQPVGLVIYDGPFSVENVQFEDFGDGMSSQGAPVAPHILRLTTAASNRGTNNRVSGITLKNAPAVLAEMEHDLGHYSKDNWAAGLWDQDGTFTGKAGWTLVPDEPIAAHPDCQSDPRFPNGLLCPGRFGLVFVNRGEAKFDLTRIAPDGTKTAFDLPTGTTCTTKSAAGSCATNHQFSFPLLHIDDSYEVEFHQDADIGGIPQASAFWLAPGETSPKVTFYKMGEACAISGAVPAGITSFPAAAGAFTVQFGADHPISMSAVGSDPASTYGWAENLASAVSFKCSVPVRMEVESPAVFRTGPWWPDPTGAHLIANTVNATLVAHVTGSNVRVRASAGPNRGKARLVLDAGLPGEQVIDVDMYKAAPYELMSYSFAPAAAGPHSITVIDLGTKNPASTNTYVVVDAAESY